MGPRCPAGRAGAAGPALDSALARGAAGRGGAHCLAHPGVAGGFLPARRRRGAGCADERGSMVTAPPIPETPVPTAVPVVVISPTPTPTIAPTPTPTLPPTPTPKTHTVRPGEYLSVIAGFYGVSMSAILELNNIPDPDNVPVGQVLILPPEAEVPAEARASGDVYRAAQRNAERHRGEAGSDDRPTDGRQRHRRPRPHLCRAGAQRAGRRVVRRVGLLRAAGARRLAGLAE